ncbi:aminotransferase class III-fold pyridoxal phosphate-dependent enzyme [Ferroplasma sp.]|uniref:aspartate aminotransferase family protein n=1 Tax=Ferroplasma sp. TaxID=2591003 RepID=UPI0026156DEE|nr:aminotransferase class III-fold pyridoxal phosphate-dependent enzyme [Ferroplasma sp.]
MDNLLNLENVPLLKTHIPGPKSKKILEDQSELETATVTYSHLFPIAISRANGSVIEDVDGNKFIDWVSGISVLNLGYSDMIRVAIKNQLDDIWHALEIPTEARIKFMSTLRQSFPPGMRDYKVMFGISGGDACETAINIAHAVHGSSSSTIAFEGAYHGVAGGIIAATAGTKYKRASYSSGFNIIRVPFPYKMWYDYDIGDIISMMHKILTDPEAGYGRPDSVIVEPILGEGGYVIPPEGFLKAIREFCDEFDLTMIVDEVQTGLGRTGKMWAFEWENIRPDIVCISKSIGGGVPVSVIYYRNDYDSKLPSPFHLGTYRANPLALAAGSVVLNEIPKYLDKVINNGQKVLNKLASTENKYIGEVRGKGFMIGIELVKDGSPMNQEGIANIRANLLNNGLLMHTCGHYGNVFRFIGALNMPDKLLDKGQEIFLKVIDEVK